MTSRNLQDPQVITNVSGTSGKKLHMAVPDDRPIAGRKVFATIRAGLGRRHHVRGAVDVILEALSGRSPSRRRSTPSAITTPGMTSAGGSSSLPLTVAKTGNDLDVAFHVMNVAKKTGIIGKEYTLGYANATKEPACLRAQDVR